MLFPVKSMAFSPTNSWTNIKPEASKTKDLLQLDASLLQQVVNLSLLSETPHEQWPDDVKSVNDFKPWIWNQNLAGWPSCGQHSCSRKFWTDL